LLTGRAAARVLYSAGERVCVTPDVYAQRTGVDGARIQVVTCLPRRLRGLRREHAGIG